MKTAKYLRAKEGADVFHPGPFTRELSKPRKEIEAPLLKDHKEIGGRYEP
jgi:hypothetical protein